MALQGKITLVSGASGVVAAGILDQILRSGATVVAPIRGNRDALLRSLGDVDTSKLDVVTCTVTEERSVEELAQYIQKKYGHLDHVITSVGGWWQNGPLLQQPAEDVLTEYKTYVFSHYLLAKYLLPLLRPARESSFTFVTGSAGEGVLILDASMVTAHLSALYGVIMCIQAEYQDKAIRVNELRIGAVIRRHHETVNAALPDEIRNVTGEFSHRAVGKAAVKLAIDTSKGNHFLKIGPDELRSLEAETLA